MKRVLMALTLELMILAMGSPVFAQATASAPVPHLSSVLDSRRSTTFADPAATPASD